MTGGTATPAVLFAAGTLSSMAGDIAYQGMTTGRVDVSQNVKAGLIGGLTGGILGAVAPKLARWLSKGKGTGTVDLEELAELNSGPLKTVNQEFTPPENSINTNSEANLLVTKGGFSNFKNLDDLAGMFKGKNLGNTTDDLLNSGWTKVEGDWGSKTIFQK